MAVQPSPYLVMTDGVDTVTFADGAGGQVNWPPIRGKWSPSIAGIRSSQLAGRGPYADVQEDLSCDIRGTTAALAWQNLDTLTRLLDKAERWWLRNEPIPPVLLKYAPQGSTIHSNATPMQAIVLGRVGSDELNGLDLPSNVNDAGFLFEIDGVRVLCMRRGAWTGASDAVTAGSSGQATVITVTWPSSHPIPSPVDVSWIGFGSTTTPILRAGFTMVGSAASDIQVVEAESGTAASYTSVADAANNARGGSVLRFTPAVTTPVNSGNITIPTTINGPVAVIAAIRNNSATTTFQIQVNVGGFGSIAATPSYLIDTSTTQPRMVLLGSTVAIGGALLQATITASAASGTLDIDYFIVVNLRDETVAVVGWDELNLLTSLGGGVSVELDYTFNPLVNQYPIVTAQNNSGSVSTPITYRGPLPFLTKGSTLYTLWCACNGASWRFTNTTPAVLTPTPEVVRYKSYLSPQ